MDLCHIVSCALLLAPALALGCHAEPFEGIPYQGSDDPVVMRSAGVAAACPDDRMIARVLDPTAGECPVVSEWIGAPLFDAATPWLAATGFHLSDDQSQLCLYTRVPGASVFDAAFWMQVAVEGLPAHGGDGGVQPILDDVSPDCVAIQPQSVAPVESAVPLDVVPAEPIRTSLLADALGPDLRGIFHEQIGWVDPLLVPPGGSEVMVAVVDTLPTGGAPDPNSEHGPSVSQIIDDLLCAEGVSCDFTVTSILGLPRFDGGVDWLDGGYIGSFMDLAGGIVEAVERWKVAGIDQPLVINLSVGWEPDLFGAPGIDQRPAVEAVEVALEYASCHGAIVVAAAGNDNDLCTEGPLLPAGWEYRAAPTQARCQALGIFDSVHPVDPAVVYHPLVHAVGGLHVRYESMPGTRALATPRLVADATYVVGGTDKLTAGHTGTSIATAVVAGVAAAVWSRDPTRNPWEVMSLIHTSGQDIVGDAHFNLVGHGPQPMRRVGMCQALDAAITTQSLSCSWNPGADLQPVLDAAREVDPEPIIVVPDFGVEESCACDPNVEVCGPVCEAAATTVHGPVTGMCELTAVDPTLAFVSPQPNDPACPTCTLSDDEVEASLHRFYEDMTIEWASVEVTDGIVEERYFFEEADLSPYDVTTLPLGSEVLQMTVEKAGISIQFAELDWPVYNDLIIE